MMLQKNEEGKYEEACCKEMLHPFQGEYCCRSNARTIQLLYNAFFEKSGIYSFDLLYEMGPKLCKPPSVLEHTQGNSC